jgi:hypothetical protein
MKIIGAITTTAVILLGLNGCGVAPSVAPTPDNGGSTATRLVGVVSNPVTGRIIGVEVAVIDGPLAGERTLTGVDGVFRLPYNFRTDGDLQFSKDGYAPLTVKIPMGAQPSGAIAIGLHLAAAPVSLGGIYTITFTADRACAQIPDELRTRSYVATVAQPAQFPQNTRFDVELSGASFAAGTLRGATLNSFYGFVEANSVGLRFANAFESIDIDEGIAEQIAPGARLEIFGSATLTVNDPASMSSPLTGYFALTDATGTRKCSSSSHLVVMTRQT